MRTLDTLRTDLRYTLRTLVKSPLFTATAVVTLAVGIGANAAVFSVVDALLLRSLPYPEPDRLAVVSTVYRSDQGESRRWSQTGTTWKVLSEHAETLDLAAFSSGWGGVNLVADGEAAYVEQQRVGAGFFRVLGVPPVRGRGFLPEEDVPGGPKVAVLSHGLWSRTFERDPEIVGRQILLKGEPHTVVGVLPEGFRSTTDADLWTPLRPSTSGEGGGTNYGIVARPETGVSLEQAEAEIAALGERAWEEQRSPESRATATFGLMDLREALTGGLDTPLFILWGVAGLVLLVVCANLAGLMLARSAGRSREIAARMALGSGRAGVVRQVLVESVVLAAVGGAFGVALGRLGLDLLLGLAPEFVRLWQPVTLDARVVGVTAVVALGASVVFGLGPALHASRLDLRGALAAGGSGSASAGATGWPRRLLVVTEVAIGVLLVFLAGLFARSFVELRGLDPGFEPEGLVTASVSLQDARYDSREEIDRLLDRSLERLRATPGIESAAVGLGLPFTRPLNLSVTVAGGEPSDRFSVSSRYVTPAYFETLRIPLLAGRGFRGTDGPDSPTVAVVNRAFVEQRLGPQGLAERPVGSRLELGPGGDVEIVGVVGDVLVNPSGLGGGAPVGRMPMLYLSADQVEDRTFALVHTWFQPAWVVRSGLPEEATFGAIRAAMREADPRLPIASLRPMEQVEAEALGMQRFLMTLVVGLAAIALALAALGIYGLVASSVAERTRELGIRMALGATRERVLRSVAAGGLGLAAAGVLVGSALALAAGRLVGSLVHEVSATDPWTLAGGALILLMVATAASLIPGLRVLDLDPARTLREE